MTSVPLERLLPELAAVEGVTRLRVSYLQPAETRSSLLDVMAATPGVAAYFDLSFQHASASLLRRMRRFGGTGDFLRLLAGVRERSPLAGVRSNVIVGFPGETEADLDELETFLEEARLDVVGVFGYSDEEGTEAAGYDGKLPAEEVAARVERMSVLVEELTSQRAEDRIGETVLVIVEDVDAAGVVEGRGEHQAPEVDGTTYVSGVPRGVARGDLVTARVVGSEGVDLRAVAVT